REGRQVLDPPHPHRRVRGHQVPRRRHHRAAAAGLDPRRRHRPRQVSHTGAMDLAPDLAPQPPERAMALPARWYCDPAIATLERRAVFDRAWHLVAHASRLRDPGDHVVVDCGGLPVIAVRGTDGTVRAFHHVCRHRAGPLARCDGRGAKALRCLYHGWTYTLDGQLRAAPEMQSAEGFDVAGVRLPQLAVREWQGLVFACADEAAAPPFEALVAGIDARL